MAPEPLQTVRTTSEPIGGGVTLVQSRTRPYQFVVAMERRRVWSVVVSFETQRVDFGTNRDQIL
jgi:hypothetical protein